MFLPARGRSGWFVYLTLGGVSLFNQERLKNQKEDKPEKVRVEVSFFGRSGKILTRLTQCSISTHLKTWSIWPKWVKERMKPRIICESVFKILIDFNQF